jgi:adenosyl cobinamide kinase/adenosyl cobinamide phosphate guanylyltransferase
VQRHRSDRPPRWSTVEAPLDVTGALRNVPPDHAVVVDCITVWVSNLMVHGLDEDSANDHADALLDALRSRSAPSIVVTNEVGLGVHPSSELGRVYRDVLGRVNRRLAEGATRAVFVAAGRVLSLHAPEDVFT